MQFEFCRRNSTVPLWDTLFLSYDCGIFPSEDGTIYTTFSETSGLQLLLPKKISHQ